MTSVIKCCIYTITYEYIIYVSVMYERSICAIICSLGCLLPFVDIFCKKCPLLKYCDINYLINILISVYIWFSDEFRWKLACQITICSSPSISPSVRTAKAEKRFIEKRNRINRPLSDKDQNQPCEAPVIKQPSSAEERAPPSAEERAIQAEKRAAWRKARYDLELM